MKIPRLAALALVAASASAAAQGTATPMPPASKPLAAAPRVDGEVRGIDVAKGIVVLRHAEIPNIAMPAMTMGYPVADRKLLHDLKVGEKVKFSAEQRDGKTLVIELAPVR